MSWSPDQYLLFESERTRAVRDLLHAVDMPNARRVIDLGCGPGNSTEILASRFPAAEVSGMDSSAEMLVSARQRMPGTQFEQGDISTWHAATPYDVILSNAVLHWVPDHETLFPRLIDSLTQGGVLAVQMPDNFDDPVQVAMREIAALPRFAHKLSAESHGRAPRRSAEWYYRLLRPLTARLDLFVITYHLPIPGGPDGIVEWFKGSGIRPFITPLNDAERADYLATYRDEVAKFHPPLPDGVSMLPFPRLFIVATR